MAYSGRNSVIDEIKSRCNIVDVIGSVVSLRKTGANYVGLCPFHNEKTPSFVVSETKQVYTCYGCHEWGDVITFVEKYYNLLDLYYDIDIYGFRKNILLPFLKESVSVESEDLMITLSNIYHSTGHVDAVATVTNENEGYPSGNYTYEWSVTPGGTGTTCYVSPDTGQRVNVGGNSSNPNSSRVEIKCIVYQNGSVYDILYNYLYFY